MPVAGALGFSFGLSPVLVLSVLLKSEMVSLVLVEVVVELFVHCFANLPS